MDNRYNPYPYGPTPRENPMLTPPADGRPYSQAPLFTGARPAAEALAAARPPRKKRGALKAVSLVLACALCGFGGGAAGAWLTGRPYGQTVVYQAAQTGGADIQPTAAASSLSDIAAAAGASVVSIRVQTQVSGRFGAMQSGEGAGSGVVLGADGTIITNNHVVEDASEITVILPDGGEYQAELLGRNPTSDIAVLRIDADGLVPAVLADSDALRVGDFCLAIGNSMGTLGGTVTDGIISALNREITIDEYSMDLVQMSAAVSPGNSGGGLFNSDGELVGIVNAKASGENLGFAIPINAAMQVARQLIESGHVSGRPSIGITVLTVTDMQAAQQAGVDGPGLYVSEADPGGAGAAAGLRAGDRIVSADGVNTEAYRDLAGVLEGKKPGDTLALVIERGGEQLDISVTLKEQPPAV